jgi:hypothetical protein
MGSTPATSAKRASCFPPSRMPASIEIKIKLIVCLIVPFRCLPGAVALELVAGLLWVGEDSDGDEPPMHVHTSTHINILPCMFHTDMCAFNKYIYEFYTDIYVCNTYMAVCGMHLFVFLTTCSKVSQTVFLQYVPEIHAHTDIQLSQCGCEA